MSDKNNYRPIALVTAASKVLELVILNKIEDVIDTTNNQFGFKKGHATDACVYSLKNVISYYKHHGSPVFTCFLDASKAFDRVNYWCLFSKLLSRKVPLLIVHLICYWYVTQLFCVKWDNVTSVFFTTSNGVRQGGILSPRFYTLYIDGLSVILSRMYNGCYIDGICTNHYFYADDMCMLAPSAHALQLLIDTCVKYGQEHDIIFNPTKSNCITFLPKRYKLYVPSVALNDNMLEYVDRVKYLGVVLTSKLNDDLDITRQVRSLYAGANTLLRKFAVCSLDVKLMLLESYCCNFYCGCLWSDFTKRVMYKLKVAYNNVFRKLLGYRSRDSASEMFVSHGVNTFECRLRNSMYKFQQRLLSSTNVLIVVTNGNTWIRNNYMWKHWQNALHTI